MPTPTPKEEKVRIVEKFWREEKTQAIKSYFLVEVLETNRRGIFGRALPDEWKACTYVSFIDYEGSRYVETRQFDTLAEAQEYRTNLLKEVPQDKLHA